MLVLPSLGALKRHLTTNTPLSIGCSPLTPQGPCPDPTVGSGWLWKAHTASFCWVCCTLAGSPLFLFSRWVVSNCEPMDCSPPGSSVHGISQARMLEWVAISFSRRSSWPRDWTSISCNTGRFFTTEPPGWCFSGWLNPAIFLGICLIDGKDHAFPSSVKLGSLQPSPAALCFCSAI